MEQDDDMHDKAVDLGAPVPAIACACEPPGPRPFIGRCRVFDCKSRGCPKAESSDRLGRVPFCWRSDHGGHHGTPQNYNLSGEKKSETISNHHRRLNQDRTGYNGHLYNWVDVKKTFKKWVKVAMFFLRFCCISIVVAFGLINATKCTAMLTSQWTQAGARQVGEPNRSIVAAIHSSWPWTDPPFF